MDFLAKKFAHDRDTIKLELVATSGPAQSAQAISDRRADLAILPANVGASAEWPVVAIVRQNVMAFIVPAAATATPPPRLPGEAKPSAKTEEVKETKGKKGAKEAKDAKTAKGKLNAKEAKNAKGDEAKSAKVEEPKSAKAEMPRSPASSRRFHSSPAAASAS